MITLSEILLYLLILIDLLGQGSADCSYRDKHTFGTVIVIGAGAAGMAAATRLMENGFNVTVLEAESRYGGRIQTIRHGSGVLDLGAQWCHGQRNNVVYQLARHHNLLSSNTARIDDTVLMRSVGGPVAVEKSAKLRALSQLILNDEINKDDMLNYNGSLGDFFMSKYRPALRTSQYHDIDSDLSDQFKDLLEKYQGWDGAMDNWYNASANGYHNYWNCPGDMLLNWKDNGYWTVFKLLMNRFPGSQKPEIPADRHIQYEREVNRINWSPRLPRPTVECTDGSVWTADHVICTVSLGVLLERIPLGFFHPTLPQQKLRKIEGLSMCTVDKFFMEFPQPFWPVGWMGFRLLWSPEDIARLRPEDAWLRDVFAFYPIDFQPSVLCGWMVGRNSGHISDSAMMAGGMSLLYNFLRDTDMRVTDPVGFVRSNWFGNPHFRGTYSYKTHRGDALGSSPAVLAAPLLRASGAPIVQFAGDATHSHYYSTVHGAIESGWREADRLIGGI